MEVPTIYPLARVETCRAGFTAAVALRERKKSQTAVELAEEKVLTRFVRQAQSAARQKGADAPDPEHYRATDDLPGYDADFIAQKERRRIQRAAEFQFPASDSNNATARAAFLLPAARPFRG